MFVVVVLPYSKAAQKYKENMIVLRILIKFGLQWLQLIRDPGISSTYLGMLSYKVKKNRGILPYCINF